MDKNVAIRKRTQIAKASKTMFIWVASASVVLGFAVVGIIFLVQMIIFNERVLKEKDLTIATLKSDNSNIPKLQSQVRALDTNQDLMSARANKTTDQAIQAILDALPSSANSLALGASLQNKLLAGINGLTIDSIQVDPVAGVDSLDPSTSVATSDSNEITFGFSVSGGAIAIQQLLHNLEISIRTIDVISFKMESRSDSDNLSLTVRAKAFFEPERVVQLKDKVVK